MNTYTIKMNDKDKYYYAFDYPAGEKQVRLHPDEIKKITEADKIKVITSQPFDIMELVLLTDAIQHQLIGPVPMSLFMPYLPYSRADRRFVVGDCFGLYAFGKLIDSLCYSDIVTVDVHSQKARKCISNLTNLDPLPIVKNTVRLIQYINAAGKAGALEETKPVILFPDKGAMERYGNEYKELGRVLHCEKVRDQATGKLSGFKVPDVKEFGKAKSVLIVDDICDGGGTFLAIADLLDSKLDKYLYVSHGIFSKGFEELKKRFKNIYTTDSFGERDKKDATVYSNRIYFDKDNQDVV